MCPNGKQIEHVVQNSHCFLLMVLKLSSIFGLRLTGITVSADPELYAVVFLTASCGLFPDKDGVARLDRFAPPVSVAVGSGVLASEAGGVSQGVTVDAEGVIWVPNVVPKDARLMSDVLGRTPFKLL